MSLPSSPRSSAWSAHQGVKLLMLGKSGISKTTRLKDLDPKPPRCSSTSGRAISRGRLAGRHHPSGVVAGEPRLLRVPRGPGQVAAAGVARFAGAFTTTSSRSLAIRRSSTATRPSSSTRSRSCRASALRGARRSPARSATVRQNLTCAVPTGLLGQEMVSALTHLQHAAARTWCSWPSSTNGSMTSTAKVFVRRSKAARPAWSCPASSTRS